MKEAILKIEIPVSCDKCILCGVINHNYPIRCKKTGEEITKYAVRELNIYIESRHPDCPLEIVEDNLRWENTTVNIIGDYIYCPKCQQDREFYDWYPPYCEFCGTKLLPPEGVEQ